VVYYLPLGVGVGGPGGSGCMSMLGPLFACSGRGPRGYIRGEVCGAGRDPLRPPSKDSAPTVLCRARRGVPGHASCVLAVLVFSSGVLALDYRASRHGRPLGWGWVCCDATRKTTDRRAAAMPISGALPISKGFDSMHASTNISRHTVIRFREEWFRSTLSRF